MSSADNPYRIRMVEAAAISLDPEFADLPFASPPKELALILDALVEDKREKPFIVWRSGPRLILLIGYDRFPKLQRTPLSVPVDERAFATREQARLFIIRWRLSRPNLTQLEISYLHGLAYQDEKQRRGGDRRSANARRGLGRTEEALAEMFRVTPATIRRGAQLRRAVVIIAGLCGRDVIPLLFSHSAHLGRKTVLDLAGVEPDQLRTVIGQLRMNGRLPQRWRRQLARPVTLGPDSSPVLLPIGEGVLNDHNERTGPEPALRFAELGG